MRKYAQTLAAGVILAAMLITLIWGAQPMTAQSLWPDLPDNDMTPIYQDGEQIYPVLNQGLAAADAPPPQYDECGVQVPAIDESTWGDVENWHQYARSSASPQPCNDALIVNAWSIWAGRPPISTGHDFQWIYGSWVVTVDSEDGAVVAGGEFAVRNNPREEGVLSYRKEWDLPPDGRTYFLHIDVIQRQDVCGNGGGTSSSTASGSKPAPTPTATMTPVPPTNTATPTATDTVTPTPSNTPTGTPPPTNTATPTATDTVTPTPSNTPTGTPPPTNTATPTATLAAGAAYLPLLFGPQATPTPPPPPVQIGWTVCYVWGDPYRSCREADLGEMPHYESHPEEGEQFWPGTGWQTIFGVQMRVTAIDNGRQLVEEVGDYPDSLTVFWRPDYGQALQVVIWTPTFN